MSTVTLSTAARLPAPPTSSSRRRAFVALLLVAPIPTLAALYSLVAPEGVFGVAAWMGSKAWLLVIPLLWKLKIDREPLSASPPRHGGLAVAAGLGLAISAVIAIAYLSLGQMWIDPAGIRATVEPFGLTNPWVYLGAVAYWVLGNSLMEEFVFRWFIASKGEELLAGTKRARLGAILLSAAAFTGHHVVALSAYFDWRVTLIASAGCFLGGAIWSALYLRYRSIWVPYLCHAIVDVAVFAIGAVLIFG